MNVLHIRLLGEFSLIYGDQPMIGVNIPRLQALLAYLLLHCNVPQPRRSLTFLFWRDSSKAQARTHLRKLCHRKRIYTERGHVLRFYICPHPCQRIAFGATNKRTSVASGPVRLFVRYSLTGEKRNLCPRWVYVDQRRGAIPRKGCHL